MIREGAKMQEQKKARTKMNALVNGQEEEAMIEDPKGLKRLAFHGSDCELFRGIQSHCPCNLDTDRNLHMQDPCNGNECQESDRFGNYHKYNEEEKEEEEEEQ